MTDLDRWLAETVMGWIWSDEHEMWVLSSERDADGRLTNCSPDELNMWHPDNEDEDRQEEWHPTSDLNQTFMCVEKMREKKFNFCIICRQDDVNIACFTKEYNFSGIAEEEERPNPALAICKAIKAALSNTKEEPK